MTVDIFTLCDSAKEYQGKLVIVGTFNTIVANQFPTIYPELAIVARAIMKQEEKGEHNLEVSVKKDNEDVYIINPFKLNVNNSDLEAEIGNVNLIFNANNISIPSEGKYIVTLKIGDTVKESTLFVNKQ